MSVKNFSFTKLQISDDRSNFYSIKDCYGTEILLGKIHMVSLPIGIRGKIVFKNEHIKTEATLGQDNKITLSFSNIHMLMVCSNKFVMTNEILHRSSKRSLTRSQSRSRSKTASRTKSSGGAKRRKTQRRSRK